MLYARVDVVHALLVRAEGLGLRLGLVAQARLLVPNPSPSPNPHPHPNQAFCEKICGERISTDGVKPCTMTCLALETLPLPAYDLMNT